MMEFYDFESWKEGCKKKYGFYINAQANGLYDRFNNVRIDWFLDGFCNIYTVGLKDINKPEIKIVCLKDNDIELTIKLIDLAAKNVIMNQDINYTIGEFIEIDKKKIGKFIEDPDDSSVLRLILLDIPEDMKELQLQKSIWHGKISEMPS